MGDFGVMGRVKAPSQATALGRQNGRECAGAAEVGDVLGWEG